MRLVHKEPCRACPWRLSAARGYLGGNSAKLYAAMVRNNEVPACHVHPMDPNHPKSRMCAGALATMANACIFPRNVTGATPEEARAVKQQVGRRPHCFAHPTDFERYHDANS